MKITRFEELIEKAVPWFIAVCLAVILWAVTGCNPKVDGSVLGVFIRNWVTKEYLA